MFNVFNVVLFSISFGVAGLVVASLYFNEAILKIKLKNIEEESKLKVQILNLKCDRDISNIHLNYYIDVCAKYAQHNHLLHEDKEIVGSLSQDFLDFPKNSKIEVFFNNDKNSWVIRSLVDKYFILRIISVDEFITIRKLIKRA